MPDVHFRYSPRIDHLSDELDFQTRLAVVIAQKMNCMNDDGVEMIHDPKTQIYFPVFEKFTGFCPVLVTMDIFAYDYPNRLLGMETKLAYVAGWVRDVLDLGPGSVAASFHPLPVGCWAKA